MHNRSRSARSTRWAFHVFAAGLLLAGCSEGPPGGAGEERSGPVALSGSVEKGPFILGSSLSIAALDAAGDPTGKIFGTSTYSDLGEFEVDLDEGGLVTLEGEGFYYDEVSGHLSGAPITLRGLAEAGGSAATARLNVITHLTHERAKSLMGTGLSLGAAIAQSEMELRAALGLSPPGFDPQAPGSEMSIFGGDSPANAYLLAVSASFLQAAHQDLESGGAVDAALQRSLSLMASDLADDGDLDPESVALIDEGSDRLDRYELRVALEERLEELGVAASVPEIDLFFDEDDDGVFDDQDNCRRVPNANQAPQLALCSLTKSAMPRPYAGNVRSFLLLDADQDGHTDAVLITDNPSEGIGVLQGDGSDHFAPPVWYAPPPVSQRALVGDFNEDGDPDLVLYNGALQVSWGGPGLSFAPPILISSDLEQFVDVGDVTGDGHEDLVVMDNTNNGKLAVFRGNGAWSFSLQPTSNILHSLGLALGHFNGDAALDVVMGMWNSDQIGLRINSGTGTFSSGWTFPVGGSPVSLSRGDFNGDGLDDVAVLTSQGELVLRLGQGGVDYFTQGPSARIHTSCSAGQIAFRDLTGDGNDDVVVACLGDSTLDVLISAGQSFSEHIELPKAPSWAQQSVGDLNGDGWLDLVYDGPERLTVQLLNL